MAESRLYKHPQVNLRLPVEAKQRMTDLAVLHGRSLNAEMVEAISAWVALHSEPVGSEVTLQGLANELRSLEQKVRVLAERDGVSLDTLLPNDA